MSQPAKGETALKAPLTDKDVERKIHELIKQGNDGAIEHGQFEQEFINLFSDYMCTERKDRQFLNHIIDEWVDYFGNGLGCAVVCGNVDDIVYVWHHKPVAFDAVSGNEEAPGLHTIVYFGFSDAKAKGAEDKLKMLWERLRPTPTQTADLWFDLAFNTSLHTYGCVSKLEQQYNSITAQLQLLKRAGISTPLTLRLLYQFLDNAWPFTTLGGPANTKIARSSDFPNALPQLLRLFNAQLDTTTPSDQVPPELIEYVSKQLQRYFANPTPSNLALDLIEQETRAELLKRMRALKLPVDDHSFQDVQRRVENLRFSCFP